MAGTAEAAGSKTILFSRVREESDGSWMKPEA